MLQLECNCSTKWTVKRLQMLLEVQRTCAPDNPHRGEFATKILRRDLGKDCPYPWFRAVEMSSHYFGLLNFC
jgi:hypothetical protein